MSKPRGYSLIELIVVISIVAILFSFGLTAYTKSERRQIGESAGAQIMNFLNEQQKNANIGKKACQGKFIGQQVVFTSPATLTATSLCEGDAVEVSTLTIPGLTSLTNATIVMNPLSLGINLGASSPLTISYTTKADLTYSFKLTSSGTIEYLGTP